MLIHEAEIEKAKALGRFRGATRWILLMHERGLPIEEADWVDLAHSFAAYEAAREALVAILRGTVGAEP